MNLGPREIHRSHKKNTAIEYIYNQNSNMVNENTRIPFGSAHKGHKLKDCPTDYLNWVKNNLWDTDFHEFAFIANKILESRFDDFEQQNLEDAADAFLREHGFNPDKL